MSLGYLGEGPSFTEPALSSVEGFTRDEVAGW
jgi:hypothetical protein